MVAMKPVYGIPLLTVYQYGVKTNTVIPVSFKYREYIKILLYRVQLFTGVFSNSLADHFLLTVRSDMVFAKN